MQAPNQHLWILGTERSGSTWIANIFDAHQRALIYMEPFAAYVGIFPGFPPRNTYLWRASKSVVDLMRSGFAQLGPLKYPLLEKPGRARYLGNIDRILVGFYKQVGHALGFPTPRRWNCYELLNLNRRELGMRQQTRKSQDHHVFVIKELRLNFKINAIMEAFPDSRFVVVLRNPAAQIASIKKLFGRGRLSELRHALQSFCSTLIDSSRFERYRPFLERLLSSNDCVQLLAYWWFINNQTVIEDLETAGCATKVITHESLSHDTEGIASSLMEFSGLDYSDHVRSFVRWSTSGEADSPTPLDTQRHSSDYYLRAIRSVEGTLTEQVYETLTALSSNVAVAAQIQQYLRGSPPDPFQ